MYASISTTLMSTVLLLAAGSLPLQAQGSTTYYFPHLAVGASWQTTITYINYSPEEVTCQTDFISDHGSPLMVSFAGLGTVVSRTDVLPPGGSVHQETNVDLSASLAPGWARATCSGPVKASLLYRLRNSAGVPTAEAGVNAATVPATRFVTFAEQGAGQFGTGVAYANPSDTAAHVTFTARDAAGQTLASVVRTLLPGGHDAHGISDLFGLPSFTGSLEITSTEPIVSLSINLEAAPVFSSLPPGDLDASAQGSTTYYFPHLAVGASWQTTITYINYSPQEVTCQTDFLSDHGSPLMVSFAGLGTVVSRTDVLPPGGSVHQETNVDLSAPLAPGWARATCSGPVKASLLYRLRNSAGVPTAEAGVNAAAVPATRFVTFAEQGAGQFGTGVAYANPSDTAAHVTFTARDAAGQVLASVDRMLSPGGHGAHGMSDLFGLPSFTGSLEITSTEPIVSLSINLEADPVFSSLPPGDLDAAPAIPGEMPAPDLVVQIPFAPVSDSAPAAGANFTLSVTVRNVGDEAAAATTLRYYRSNDTTISSSDTPAGRVAVSALPASGTSAESIPLTAPSSAGTYYYGACVDPVSGESDTGNNCSSAVRVTVNASQIGSAGFDLASEGGSPEGIAFANNRFYVVDDFDEKVYAYTVSGQRDSASDFDLDSDNGSARGIAFANNRFYVVDFFDEKVYAYTASGQRDSASDFDLDSDNDWPGGITFANNRFYVVDNRDEKVYAYTASGQRDSASDFDLDSANRSAKGITFANNRFYVVDNRDEKVYAYTASGQRDSASDFDLDSANRSAEGITFANNRFYVVDDHEDRVYAYSPGAAPGTTLGFSEGESATRGIWENTPPGINVGGPVSAVGGDSLTYTISGTDSESFVILPETGQIRTRENVVYDYEVKNRYAVTVGVEDDDGNSDTINVTILIRDLVPSCVSVSPLNLRTNNGDGRLTLRWSPLPDLFGNLPVARVLGYETEIRPGTGGAWGDRRRFLGRSITAMIYADLINGLEYQVHIRPINAEGDCGWSTPVSAIPTADFAPKEPEGPIDRFGPQPVGTPERNFRFLTQERCRHTSNGQTLDANCEYENTGPNSGRIFLEFDDPSQGSCEITLAYSSLTAGSFIDECFDAGVNTNVPFDRSFRMPRLAPRTEDDFDPPIEEVPQLAPRNQDELDVLVFGRDDFIPGLCFGNCLFGKPPERGVARQFFVEANGVLGEHYGDYTYENTGPSQGVLTFALRASDTWVFTLDFEPSGNVRVTTTDPDGNDVVWPGSLHVDLTLGAQPILLPIPPSWSAAIAIETDVAPEDFDDWVEQSILQGPFPTGWQRTLFGGLFDRLFGEYGDGGLATLYTREYEKLGRNRAIMAYNFDYTSVSGEDSGLYESLDDFQREIFGSTWVFDLTFTSNGAAKFTLTITKEGHPPTVIEGFVDFAGDSIDVDEFPEELLLPDDPPQASGEDRSEVEVAAAVGTQRIGGDDVLTFLVNNPGLQTAAYSPGDWLEPKDGSNQRMMIVGAGQVSAARRGQPSPAAPAQFHPQILKSQATVSAHSSPNFAEAVALLGRKAGSLVYSNSNSAITRLSVVCMQIDHDIPTRGARYFSVPKTAQNDVQGCQRNCVLEETENMQLCVWKCEANVGGN